MTSTLIWTALAVTLTTLVVVLARRLERAQLRLTGLDARLAAILEGSATGLAVWTRDGSLRACNQVFRDFYPDAPIKPGVVFEDLLRYTGNRGLVRLEDDRDAAVEAWVAERVAAFGRPRSEIWRTPDDRWIDVHSRSTEAGEVVLLLTDTTGLRGRPAPEVETADWGEPNAGGLGSLADLLEAVAAAESVDAAATQVLGRLADDEGFAVGFGYRLGDDGESLEPLGAWYPAGSPEEPAEDGAHGLLRALVATERPRRGEGLAGRVFQTGRLAWVPNVSVDPTVSDAQRAAMDGLKGACVVPVLDRGVVVGVLVWLSATPLMPDATRARLLGAGAAVLAPRLTTRAGG